MISPIGAIRPAGIDSILSRISELHTPPTAPGQTGGNAVSATAGATISNLLNSAATGNPIDALEGTGSVSFSDLLANINATGKTGQGGVDGALEWADTQIGTPYASVNPYRFGDVPWDGGAHLSVNGNGKTYQFPQGTKVYDCSGFATAVWRKAGIDLETIGAATTEGMAQNLPTVAVSEARKGDIVLIDSNNDGQMDHCQILTGDGRAIHASGNGVQYTTPDWSHTVSVVRPSLLASAPGTQMTGTNTLAAAIDPQTMLAALLAGNT